MKENCRKFKECPTLCKNTKMEQKIIQNIYKICDIYAYCCTGLIISIRLFFPKYLFGIDYIIVLKSFNFWQNFNLPYFENFTT